MTRSPSIAGVILAAGASSRMGQDKALLPWHGRTFLTAAIEALIPVTDFVVVVAGENVAGITPLVHASGAFLVRNTEPERGQFSSLQVGLQEVLNRGRDAAIVTLVDRPPVAPATLAELRSAFLESLEMCKWAVVPDYNGRHGHPILLSREMLELMLRAGADASARDVLHAHKDRVTYVPVEDQLTIENVDTPADYDRITQTT